ncbi:MAG TPA: metal-dependent hydrolase [Flavobacteriaceae bacterium]|nr:metal-dependent hydrolase [Flavobacteriaceae bacterium]
MDSLTQIVLGAAVGEVVLGRKVGNKAMLYGAIAGTIPDLDVFVGNFTDVVTALEIHRGFSHSFVFAILAAPLLGFFISLYEKKATWREWAWLMFFGFVTHSLLDAQTTWGTQLFWPFDLRVASKNIFVIDPLYTLPLSIGVICAMFQKKSSAKRKKYNRLGLIISTSYLLLTIVLKGFTYFKFEKAIENQGITYSEIETKPTALNSILWSANVKTTESFLIGYYSLFDTKPIHFSKYPKNHELLGNLKNNDKIERMAKISKRWYTISEENGELYFNDLRYGTLSLKPNATNFVFSYKIDTENGKVYFTEKPKESRDAKMLLTELWQRIKGN